MELLCYQLCCITADWTSADDDCVILFHNEVEYHVRFIINTVLQACMTSHLTALWITAQHVGSLYFFSKKKDKPDEKKTDQQTESMLCKFVIDGTGKRVGESVSVDKDVLIIKSGALFLGVPLKHVENTEKTLVVKGLLDYSKAMEMGEKWQKEALRDMNQKDGAHGTKR